MEDNREGMLRKEDGRRELRGRRVEGGRKVCSQDTSHEMWTLEGDSLVSILFAPSRKMGEGLAEGHKASMAWQD